MCGWDVCRDRKTDMSKEVSYLPPTGSPPLSTLRCTHATTVDHAVIERKQSQIKGTIMAGAATNSLATGGVEKPPPVEVRGPRAPEGLYPLKLGND